jgi:hypothetical protein
MKIEELVKTRKISAHPESGLQISCITWFRLQYPRHVIFAIPNGGKRAKKTFQTKNGTKQVPLEAKIMKSEGVLAGVSDLFLMCPGKGFCGLFIEMKYDKGTQSPSQKVFEKNALKYGYKYVVCNSLEGFMRIVNDYLR